MAEATRKRTCAAMQQHFYLADTDAIYRENRRFIETNTRSVRVTARTTIVRIPVVVHVLYHDDAENIDVSQVQSQIAALNRDYREQNADSSAIPEPFKAFATDTLIEFGLAVQDPDGNPTTGITRTRTSKTTFPYNPADPQATKKLDDM